MKDHIRERVIDVAQLIIELDGTVRSVAKEIHMSKSTVHKDLRERLPKISPSLYNDVNEILEKNKNERALRGGQATREYWEKRRGDLLG
jgi:putative DeoR family transcriptional regulator (stage III sporulation protein D)